MMCRYVSLILTLFLLGGCSSHKGFLKNQNTENVKAVNYRTQIEQWKIKVHHEGWSKRTIKKVANWSRTFVKYIFEYEKSQAKPQENPHDLYLWDILVADHWVTPKEFIHLKRFKGDCDDIAPYMWSVFKALDYPHKVRVAWYKVPFVGVGHVVLKIEMPDGKWKLFDSTPMGGLEYVDRLFYRKVVEFDENEILASNKFYGTNPHKAIQDWQLRVKKEGLF